MSLQSLIDLAGGVNNILRILAPQGRVVVAIQDANQVAPCPEWVTGESVLGEWQLSMSRDESIDDKQLAQLGEQIAKRQREKAKDFLQPVSCPYRPHWHVSPPQGLLNDPNGFIYHNGEYHLFYQWYPYACEHKDKYWVHLKSQDLLNWSWQSIALTPSDWFDSHGVFSGHAVSHEDELYLYYTGNTRLGADRYRQTMQCMARLKEGGSFEKLGPVIRTLPQGVTEHFRDPKVFCHNNKWHMLLGAQTTDLQGRLAVYHSQDLFNWEFDSLYGDEISPFGYMWECPDWFELSGSQFFVFGPQGIKSDNPNHTIEHQNRIFKSQIDEKDQFQLLEGWQLDGGFDFYAPQSMQTPDGRRVMCGWMGLPDEVDHPSCDSGWIHQLTVPRELKWLEGRIVQQPIEEIAQLRGETQQLLLSEQRVNLETNSFELNIVMEWDTELQLMSDEEFGVKLVLDSQSGVLRFDRSNTQIRQGDTIRELALPEGEVKLQILADSSSLEIFINDGEFVMSGRVFTPESATGVALKGAEVRADVTPLHATQWSFAPVS